MPSIIKPDTLEFKSDPNALTDFKLKTLIPRLGSICKSTHFSFDIRQLDPGMYSFPYHSHRNSEELMMILSGSLTLRSAEGLKIVNKGELVFCEIGDSGAHQFYNHGNKPCIYLDIRSTVGIDIADYPDSGKINILPFREIYEKDSKADYNKGEERLSEIWEKLGQK